MKLTPAYLLATAALGLGLAGCSSPSTSSETATGGSAAAPTLTPGPWRGVLATQGQEIPFLFEVKTEADKPVVYLINAGLNGEERLRCDDIKSAGDSTTIRLHAFDAALVVRADGTGKLKGTWVKYDTKDPYRVPLTATAGAQELFPAAKSSEKTGSFGGTWRANFGEGEESYPATGVFTQKGDKLTGTFLTTTGDYRYLSGQVSGQDMRVSTFDGSHAFLFTAHNGPKEPVDITKEYAPNTLFGDFYSGKAGHETWTAVPDPKAKLPDADTLTYLKKGESRLNFKFPNVIAGSSISPTDPKYRGKVVVLQILGSWCPNCMDETNFLAPWYEKNKARGVEIIGLGYERSGDYAVSVPKLRSMRERFKMGYDVAFAGVSNKDSVAQSLPQLAKFLAFPTTIFLDKKGNVRKIHTGFSGPGTGKYYQEEIDGFNQTIDKLLKE
ncbi:TlpA family protein disulfide reductase [Hymenobacter sp. DH14]|uniref:TlpA family protein disulfide reductase n=1 Tax=Hymenobacter cyanobacteriorum TaxID=2926463 RepID=A0A9X2AGG8_9BACT|nr:TlpA disulfide reductase family protein [Hymenobacter cyanobacteriorum]MCI1189216.1 TlpA family protein disulfide reductase [Hymenobacter cyanobacteriorum]